MIRRSWVNSQHKRSRSGQNQRSYDLEDCTCLYSGNNNQLCSKVMILTGLTPNGDIAETEDEQSSPMDISITAEELETMMDTTYAEELRIQSEEKVNKKENGANHRCDTIKDHKNQVNHSNRGDHTHNSQGIMVVKFKFQTTKIRTQRQRRGVQRMFNYTKAYPTEPTGELSRVCNPPQHTPTPPESP